MHFVLLLVNFFAIASSFSIQNVQFTSDSYTGYISENVLQTPSSSSTTSSDRHNRNIASPASSSVFVRFVDRLKPAVTFDLASGFACTDASLNKASLELNSDYDRDALSLFKLDASSLSCFPNANKCVCYIKLSLADDSAREKLNREAKDAYSLQIKLNSAQAQLNVIVLDDNDLEPMFDPSEYSYEINEAAGELSELAVIGRVGASDPDLSRNGLVRYYLNSNPSYDSFFGVDWTSGEVYLKKSSSVMFAQLEPGLNEKEYHLEVKSIDGGLKLSIANNLLNKFNPASLSSSNRTRKTVFYESSRLHNESLLDEEDDAINYKFVLVAADPSANNLNKHFSKLTGSLASQTAAHSAAALSSSSFSSLEVATVKIKLARARISLARVAFLRMNETDLSEQPELGEQIRFVLQQDANRVPFGLIKSVSRLNKRKLSIQPAEFKLGIEELYLRSGAEQHFLVYFVQDARISEFREHAAECSVRYGEQSVARFRFELVDDFLAALSSTCSLSLRLKIAHPSLAIFRAKIRSVFQNTDYCRLQTLTRSNGLFSLSYAVSNPQNLSVSLNSTTGVLRLFESKRAATFLISSSLSFNNQPVLLSSSLNFEPEISSAQLEILSEIANGNKKSLITHSSVLLEPNQRYSHSQIVYKLTGLNSKPKRVGFKLIYCRMMSAQNKTEHFESANISGCAFYVSKSNGSVHFNLNETSQFNSAYRNANLFIRLSDGDKQAPYYNYISLVVTQLDESRLEFEHKECFVGVKLINNKQKGQFSSKFYTSMTNNYLDNPISLMQMKLVNGQEYKPDKYEFGLSVINEHLDTNCFYFNTSDASIYLKCKLPLSILNQNQHAKQAWVIIKIYFNLKIYFFSSKKSKISSYKN